MLILSIILGVLQIICGCCMFLTPLSTFMGIGYFIIILFYLYGIFGVIRAVHEKKYRGEFFFSLLTLILGVIGMVIPGAAILNNFIILYMLAAWLLFRGILSLITTYHLWKMEVRGAAIVLGVLTGVLDLICAILAIAYPMGLAIAIGFLIGIFFIETGIQTITMGITLSQLQDTQI